jgi:hypothetical protein
MAKAAESIAGFRKNWRGPLLRVVCPLVLLLAVFCLYHRPLFNRAYAIPWDLPDYHGPVAATVSAALRDGRLPLWDPYTYCGNPFHNNLQAQIFYPPAWPFFALGAIRGTASVPGLLEWEVALHAFLAGLFAYGLGRRLGLSKWSALFAALLFESGGYFASQSQHLGAICSAAWIPLAWWAAVELKDRVSFRWTAVLAAAFSLSLLAGFPAVGLVGGCTTFLLAVLLRLNWRGWIAFASASAWAVALAAVQLWPLLELLPLSLASDRGLGAADPGGVLPIAFLSLLSPILVPDVSGYNSTFFYYYSGIALPLLAIAGLLRRAPHRWTLALLTATGAIWLLGQHTPIVPPIWRAAPDFVRSAAYQEFALPAFLLSMSLLAGLGFEWLLAMRKTWIVVSAIAATLIDPLAVNSRCRFISEPAANYPRLDYDYFEGSPLTPKALRSAIGDATPPARFDIWHNTRRWYAYAPLLLAGTPAGDDPLVLKHFIAVRRRYAPSAAHERYAEVKDPNSEYLSRLNVGVLIAQDIPGTGPPGWPLGPHIHGHSFYINPQPVWPRFYLSAGGSTPAGAAPVRVLRYEPEHVELDATSPAATTLVSSEAWYPGWKATIDGLEAPLIIVNEAFRGLKLPPGNHRITMTYSPGRLKSGAAVSLAALAMLILALSRRRA